MAIDYGPFCYAGPPRTGSTWVMHAATEAGLREFTKATMHLPHDDSQAKPRLVSVRHPCRWLRSFFCEIHLGAVVDNPALQEFLTLDCSSFDAFVRSYLDQCPGAVGRMFAAYRGDVYMRLEDQPLAFANFLDSMGINGRPALTVGPKNKGRARQPVWSPPLWRRTLQAEASMLEDFIYGEW